MKRLSGLSVRENLAFLAARYSPSDGSHRCGIDGVTVKRISKTIARVPVFYEPCAVFVVQGRKHALLGTEVLTYDAGHVLLLGTPLPFVANAYATRGRPMLAVYVRLRRELVSELSKRMSLPPSEDLVSPCPLLSVPFDDELAETLNRTLIACAAPMDAQILGPQLIREMTYLILRGPGGRALRSSMGLTAQHNQITRAIHSMHAHIAKHFSIADLCMAAGMSSSVFHVQFKLATGTTPVQYLKALRLHRARTLMLEEQQSVGAVAGNVGYKSLAQFSRDYKRLFKYPPSHPNSLLRSEPMLS